MLTIHGKGVSGGVAIGHARHMQRHTIRISQTTSNAPPIEWQRFLSAKNDAVKELEDLYNRALDEVGEVNAQIFSVHAMIAQDEDFSETIREKILSDRTAAEYAVSEAAKHFSALFSQMDDAYMRERATDILDVADRILHHLTKENLPNTAIVDERTAPDDILCADDLTPGETIRLDKSRIRAILTAHGSANSHTAILSRTMNIPAIVGIHDALAQIPEGALLAIDADNGFIYLDPEEATLRSMQARIEKSHRTRELLEKYRGRESRTPDGRRVEICANIGTPTDIGAALNNDADGIGLFRSEFLYLGRNTPPSEEEQLAAYRRALTAMPGKRVVIRTLDIGADKKVPYFDLPPEENTALGCRAIRISLTHPDIFLTQARALLRASCDGRLAVMFPMVISTEEVIRLKALWQSAAEQLREQNIPFAEHVELGIMIETPAAALISDRLAPMVDFFSIGTNDLTQYTLALDRQNEAIDSFCDPHHEAILRLIRMTVENAHRAGIWVGICGELGADLSLTDEFLRMGIDELSVTPPAILPLREKVCTSLAGGSIANPTASEKYTK